MQQVGDELVIADGGEAGAANALPSSLTMSLACRRGPLLGRRAGAPLRYCRTVIDIIGMAGGLAPVEPENGLSEKLKTPPSSATIR